MSIAGPLDKDLPVPLYHQLQELLRAEIEAAKWRPGEQLPSETKLAESYQVSKITLRQALENLAKLGYIRREHGRGTFVERRKFDEGPRDLTSFTEEMRRHERVASARVLSQRVVEADAQVADALGLPVNSRVFELKRLRLGSGEPMGVQTAYLPDAFVPGIRIDEHASLYEVLQRQYRLYAARARETYIAAAADAESAKLLGIPAGAPVFCVERITLLDNQKPFEFVQSTVRGDRYSIVLDLVKHDGGQRVLQLRQPVRKRKLTVPR